MLARFAKSLLVSSIVATGGVQAAIDAGKTMEQVCLENGYSIEKYTVVTDDDYILSLYRIPGTFKETAEAKKQSKNASPKPAVLMMHGLDSNHMQWVMNDAEKANAFILANEGYDVWMGNNRGNNYSKAHLTLSPSDKDFWDYYQMEMGLSDTPALIDYILAKTGNENLSYIGHS